MTTMRAGVTLLPMLLALACGAQPAAHGVLDRKLSACPAAPHCVSTQANRPAVAPLPYRTSREQARERLVSIIRVMPGATIVTEAPDYIHAEFTSRRLHYVDDLEVFLDDRDKLAHFRSESRSGFYDFGANRRRIQKIRDAFVAEK